MLLSGRILAFLIVVLGSAIGVATLSASAKASARPRRSASEHMSTREGGKAGGGPDARLKPGSTPDGSQAAAAPVEFIRDIQPIFRQHCYECHGPTKSRARLRLDSRHGVLRGGLSGPAIVAGNSGQSLLVRRLLGQDGEERMPKDTDALPADKLALIRAWIDHGAAGPADGPAESASGRTQEQPDHWAYRRPIRPPLPDVRTAQWVRAPIDRFVLARLEKDGLAPSHEAPFETLLRRVSLDLIGLPPSPQEVDAAVAEAAREGNDAAYGKFVDRLLASPHYGERWARPWLDLARYADSNGFEKDNLRVMWKYRDWVIDALNADMPFDKFTIEQIAGDMLPNATPAQRVASGFHRNAMTNEEGGIDPGDAHYEVLVDRVNTTATVWLGSTLACAQCHNHKYDPFSQKDYFRMLAFFENLEYEVAKLGDGTKWKEPQIDLPTPEQEAKRKTIQSELDRLNERLRTQTPELDRSQRLWEQAMKLEPAKWKVLTPKKLSATGGVELTAQADGAIVASGANPGETYYTLEATTPLPRVTAIRLEALPDPSLPKNGPGRDPYGNFQLNGFEVEASPLAPAVVPTSGKTRVGRALSGAPLKFSAIKADDAAGGASLDTFFPKTLRRDSYAPRGWRIDASRDDTRLPRQIVFTLDRPLVTPAGARLRIRLNHQGTAVSQALGRFRVSVTSTSRPQRIVEVTAKLRPILAIAPAERSEQQRKDLSTLYRGVAASLKPERDRVAGLQKQLRALEIPTALVMQEKVAYARPAAFVRRRGSFLDKGEQVYASVPDLLHPLREDQMPNRLGLAHWLVDEQNPLTARVAVNRAWEQFFGRGLVETSEDFGTQGTPPSHPELLDWLATEYVRQGWRTKALHTLIVTSATYRQSSAAPPALLDHDPFNRLLARGPRFRLEAETIRDQALAASGLLSRKIGGPSVFPPQPDGIWDIPYSDDKWLVNEGENRYRRGLYVFIRRTAAYPSFMTFDATSREYCTVRRVRTNTPLQALTTLNDEAYFEAARALAARMIRERPSDVAQGLSPANLAAYGFRLCVTRTPKPEEVNRIVASYTSQVERFRKEPQAAAKVIAGYAIDGVDAADQAAWTLVANALLNLDETLTKE